MRIWRYGYMPEGGYMGVNGLVRLGTFYQDLLKIVMARMRPDKSR